MADLFPTLELGDLESNLADSLTGLPDEDDDTGADGHEAEASGDADDPAADTAGEDEHADEAGADQPEGETSPEAGEAQPAGDVEATYRERSKKDIAAVRAPLDREIATLRSKAAEVSDEVGIHLEHIKRLEAQLAEWDEDAVKTLRTQKVRTVEQAQTERRAVADKRQRLEGYRASFYEGFPGVDPQDPDLVAAFEVGVKTGDFSLEQRLAKRLAQQATSSPKQAKPAATPQKTEKAQATKAREQARGTAPSGRGAAPPAQKKASTLEEGDRQFRAGLARLGLR